jgi:beta-galactosidase
MFGGTGDLISLGVWKNIDSAKQKGKPAFYQTTFSIKQNKSSSDLTVWRVNADGLGHGSVWVNGHNLNDFER